MPRLVGSDGPGTQGRAESKGHGKKGEGGKERREAMGIKDRTSSHGREKGGKEKGLHSREKNVSGKKEGSNFLFKVHNHFLWNSFVIKNLNL